MFCAIRCPSHLNACSCSDGSASLGRSVTGLVESHLNDDSPRHGLNTRLLARCASTPNHQRTGTSRRGEPLRNVICLERRRVPRTFWGSNEPRADAVAPWRALRPYLIQMGVWCASATDVQPRERKTGCAWTDDRESSDASTRQRIRAPLDKGPVNGRPVTGKLPNRVVWPVVAAKRPRAPPPRPT